MAKTSAKANAQGRRKSSYDAFKEFKGQRYTGMKVGRGHKWKYEAGDWVETKVTPDRWDFRFAVNKRRAGKAPEGGFVLNTRLPVAAEAS